MRRFSLTSLTIPAIAAFAFFAVPDTAAAQPPQADDFEDGFYVWAAPAGGAVAFGGDDNIDHYVDLSYQTAIGGSYFIRRGNFMASFGLTPELLVYNFDEPYRYDMRGVQFRALGDIKLGGGVDWFFIYGYLKPGFVLSHMDWDWDDCGNFHGNPHWWDCGNGGHYDATSPGFNFGTGGGAMFKIYKGLAVGAETGVDLGFFFDNDHPDSLYFYDFMAYAAYFF